MNAPDLAGDMSLPDLPPAVEMGEDMPAPDLGQDMPAPDMMDADMGAPKTSWTVLVYLAADNNLESSGIDDLKEMMSVPDADHVNIIVQTDRAEEYYELGLGDIDNWRESKRLKITNGVVNELESLGEQNTGDPATLQGFIEWGFQTYPADRKVLILWNHGNAWRGYGNDDSSDHDLLTNAELDQALSMARGTLGLDKFDLLGFDACLMAEDSVLRLARSHASYMLASEELEPGHGWDYGELEILVEEPDIALPAFGEHIAEGFKQQARDERRHLAITLSLLDLEQADAVTQAIDNFADAVTAQIPSSAEQIGAALAESQQYGKSSDEEKSYHSIDVMDFAERLAPLGGDVATRSQELRAALDDLVLFEIDGARTKDSNGLAAYFPRLPQYYDEGFDQVEGVDRWRAMVRAYLDHIEQNKTDAPAFMGGGVESTGTCGDGVCEVTRGEDPIECPVDCARTGPTYDLPACADLVVDPTSPSASPRTYPVCFGDYSVQCVWGEYGSWVRKATFCGENGECAAPLSEMGMMSDPNRPANYGTCRVRAQSAGASCSTGGDVQLERQVDTSMMAGAARAYLHFGFYPSQGAEPLIVGREEAEIDRQTGAVSTRWNQRLLTVEQGGFTAVLFAESTRSPDEPALVLHEIPVEYTEPAPCACDLPGDPGFADSDGDRVSNCLDPDDDGDGIADAVDNCPFIENQAQTDSDGDGVGDACAMDSGAPMLTCQPDPTALFGARQDAYLHVVTNEVTRESVSWSLYVRTPGGVAQATPLPGARIWPRVLRLDQQKERSWASPKPLPFNLLRALSFTYNDLSGQLVLDERGVPTLGQQGQAQTIKEALGLNHFFMELVVESASGDTSQSSFIGQEQDVSSQGCAPQDPPLCNGGQIADCDGKCVDPILLGDGTCHEGSAGIANFACKARSFDRNDCPSPACPAGLTADCDGRCFDFASLRGDGTCHDGTNRALPKLSCALFAYDDGDCPCGDMCSGNGTCTNDMCMCSGGFTGMYCQTPPTCGDAMCGAGEHCRNCETDCGMCPNPCGNGVCEAGAGEDCTTCAADCGACACGDGVCSGMEDCTSCPGDCGDCPQCGDTVCEAYSASANFAPSQGESCFNCPGDCGACQNDCCTPSEESGLYAVGGGCSDSTVAACVCAMDPTCCEAGWPARCRDLAASSCGLNCCTPDCSGKDCGPDGCGGSCGTCSGDTVCAPTRTCELPPRQDCCDPYAATGCAQDNVCESCVCAIDSTCCTGAWTERCSALASQQCNTECSCGCIPSCDGKSCGDDGCGGSCGACAMEEACNTTTGACTLASCASGTDECDGDMTVTCETDILNNPAHCGACGKRCATDTDADTACSMGQCALTCASGFLDCNGDLGQGGDGCETQAASCPLIGWTYTYGDNNNDLPVGSGTHLSLAVDGSGNLYGASTTGPDFSFDGTPYALGRQGTLLFSLTAAGAPRWSSVIRDSGTSDAVVKTVEFEPVTGDLFVAGNGFGGDLLIDGVNVASLQGPCSGFVARIASATGAAVWATSFTGNCNRMGDVAFSASGEVYVGGYFSGSNFAVGANTFSAGAQGDDGYIAKLDPATGAVTSAFQVGGGQDGHEQIEALAVLPGGDIVFSGRSAGGALSLGPNSFPNQGAGDGFYARYTAAGAHVWSNAFGTAQEEGVTNMRVGPNGEIVISGYNNGPITIGGTTLSGGNFGMFVARLNPMTGAPTWVTGHDNGGGNTFHSGYNAFVFDANGDVRLGFTSTSSPTTTFGGVALPQGNGLRVVRLDGSTGLAQDLVTIFPSSGSAFMRGLAITPSGQMYAIGYFNNTTVIDVATLVSNGLIDHFVAELLF